MAITLNEDAEVANEDQEVLVQGRRRRREGGKEGRREGGKEGRRDGGKEGRRGGRKEGRKEGRMKKRGGTKQRNLMTMSFIIPHRDMHAVPYCHRVVWHLLGLVVAVPVAIARDDQK
jgi:flagellar biosynthesis/type III secretory pathway protein FliH